MCLCTDLGGERERFWSGRVLQAQGLKSKCVEREGGRGREGEGGWGRRGRGDHTLCVSCSYCCAVSPQHFPATATSVVFEYSLQEDSNSETMTAPSRQLQLKDVHEVCARV